MGIAVTDEHFQIEGNFYPQVANLVQDGVVFAFPDDAFGGLAFKDNYVDEAQDLEAFAE